MKQRSWGDAAFPWLFPRLARISYTTQDHLPSHVTTPRKLRPSISTSIKKMLYRLPRVQSGRGDPSSEVPSFLKLSKQANEQAISPTATMAKQCWQNALIFRCGGIPLKFYHLENFGGEVMNLGKPRVLERTQSQKRNNMHNLNNWSDPRVTIQCNCWNAYSDFLEFSISFFLQYPQATQRDNVECVSILLTHGANPHIVDFGGDAALHHAVVRGNIAIAGKLLKYKANIDTKTEVKIIQLHLQCTSSNDTQITFHILKLKQTH